MKKFLAPALIFSFFITMENCKKSSAVDNNTLTPQDTIPLVTNIGTPVGTPITKTIDASGGSMVSADGILHVIIPAGALSASTNITVQPVTNELTHGVYNGYSLTPDGQKFQKPVTLEFHYKDSDLDTFDVSALTVAYQLPDKSWRGYTEPVIDTVNKTISVTTTHFTLWDILEGNFLYPKTATVKTGQSIQLAHYILEEEKEDSTNINMAIPLHRSVSKNDVWAVNGIQGGNSTYGTITSPSEGYSIGTYTAPAKAPNPNVVTVSKTFYTIGSRHIKIVLTSLITIVDGAGYHVDLSFKVDSVNEAFANWRWTDKGSFNVIVSGNTATVKNTANADGIITLVSNTSSCTSTLFSPTIGPINLVDSGVAAISLPTNTITVFFNSLDPKNYYQAPIWKYDCGGGVTGQTSGGMGPAFPSILQFSMVDSMQTFVSGQYTTTVTRIK